MTTTPLFRVWDGQQMEYNVMAGKFGVFYVNPMSGNGLDPEDAASLTSLNTKYFEPIDTMMGLGILDKNGVEFFEEDIIETSTGFKSTIKRNEFGFYFENVENVDIKLELSYERLQDSIIISNTYKNKYEKQNNNK